MRRSTQGQDNLSFQTTRIYLTPRTRKVEAAQEHCLEGVSRYISPKIITLVRIENRTDERRTAIAVVRSIMTQYAMKEAMRLVEPEPAESRDIKRALFTGS